MLGSAEILGKKTQDVLSDTIWDPLPPQHTDIAHDPKDMFPPLSLIQFSPKVMGIEWFRGSKQEKWVAMGELSMKNVISQICHMLYPCATSILWSMNLASAHLLWALYSFNTRCVMRTNVGNLATRLHPDSVTSDPLLASPCCRFLICKMRMV